MSTNLTSDWRANQRKPSASSKRLQGYLLLLCSMGFLALLTWWLWPSTAARTYVVKCRMDMKKSELTRLHYAKEDQENFGNNLNSNAQVLDLQTLTLGEQIDLLDADIRKKINDSPNPKKDTLVFYFSCHTAAYQGKAYLLSNMFSNFTNEKQSPKNLTAVPLSQLLNKIKALPFKHKIILLDGSRLPPDARLGSLIDEFPLLAQEAIKKIEDPNLWMITATNKPHQRAVYSDILEGSIFGLALGQAFSNGADADANQALTLQEFYQHLNKRSSSMSAGQQLPQLLKGGKGLCTTKEDGTFVISRLKPPAPETPTDDDTANRKNNWPRQPLLGNRRPLLASVALREPTSSTRRTSSRARPRNKPDFRLATLETKSQENTAETDSSPKEEPELLTQMDYLWSLRDLLTGTIGDPEQEIELLGTTASNAKAAILPLDSAPQLWRRINLRLIRLDQHISLGPKQPSIHTPFKGNASEALKEFQEICGQNSSDLLLGKLAKQLNQICQDGKNTASQKQDAWEKIHPELLKRRQLLRVYCRLLFNAPNYLQWQDRTSFYLTTESPTSERDLDSYLDKLFEIRQLLDQSAQTPQHAHAMLEGLVELEQEIYHSLQIHLNKALTDLDERCKQGHWLYRQEQEIQNLLAVPLLRAKERKAARETLRAAKEKFDSANEKNHGRNFSSDGTSDSISHDSTSWMTTKRRATLYAKLVRLTNPEQAEAIENLLSQNSSSPKTYREIGTLLHQYYKNLNHARIAASTTEQTANSHSQNNLKARLADGRDWASYDLADKKILPLGLPKFTFLDHAIAKKGEISLTPTYALVTKEGKAEKITVSLKASGTSLGALYGILSFDHNLGYELFETKLTSGQDPILLKPSKEFRLPYNPKKLAQEYEFSFSSLGEFPDELAGRTSAKLSIRNGNDEELASIDIPIHDADASEFQLIAEHKVFHEWDQIIEDDYSERRLLLEGFPNRENSFRFGIINKTPIDKEVQVLFHRVNDPSPSADSPNDILQGGVITPERSAPPKYSQWQKKLAREKSPATSIAHTSRIQLLANSPIHWLEFSLGRPTTQNSGDSDSKPSAEPATQPDGIKTPAKLPKGLLCEIRSFKPGRDKTASPFRSDSSFYWIEITPKDPSRYVNQRTIKNDSNLTIELELRKQRPLPFDVNSKSVEVYYQEKDADYYLLHDTKISPLGSIKPAEVVTLGRNGTKLEVSFANNQGPYPSITLGVDGYPSVFHIDGNDGEAIHEYSAVAIEKLQPVTAKGKEAETIDEMADGTKSRPFLFNDTFHLQAHLQVAVPDNWNRSPGNYIQLERINHNNDRQIVGKVYSDVSHSALLTEIRPNQQGLGSEFAIQLNVSSLKMDAYSPKVGDFNGKLKASVYKNGMLQRQSKPHKPIFFIVDTKAPTRSSIRFSKPWVTQGDEAELLIAANDRNGSGLTHIKYYWDDGTNEKEKRKEAKPIRLDQPEASKDEYRISIDTSKLSPGTYYLMVNLFDRVQNESKWIEWEDNQNTSKISLEIRKKIETKKPKLVKTPPPPVVYGLRVQLRYASTGRTLDDRDAKNCKVLLSNGSELNYLHKNIFSISNIPAGDYTITASGAPSGRTIIAELKDLTAKPVTELATNIPAMRLDSPPKEDDAKK